MSERIHPVHGVHGVHGRIQDSAISKIIQFTCGTAHDSSKLSFRCALAVTIRKGHDGVATESIID